MRIKVEMILKFMKKYEIRPYRLCRLCNVSRRHLNNVLTNNKEATCYALFRISLLMGITINDLIDDE